MNRNSTTLVILFLFTARLIQIVVLFLFTMNQYYTSWRLIGELFFYSMFLVTYCLATGIYVLVRRPAIAPVRDTGALRLAQIQQQQ